MGYYSIGELVKKLRIQRGLSQEVLSHGIMTQANLSRFESGEQLPGKEHIDAILQRLGIDTQETFRYHLNKKDFEIYKKCDYLQSLIANNKNLDASILIDEVSKLPEFSNGAKKQFLLTCTAAIMVNLNKDNNEIRKFVIDALIVTLPTFSCKYISSYYLSDQETRLINILSITYFNENNLEKAIEILNDLKKSLDSSRIDEKQKSKLYPLILYNLSKYYGLSKKYLDAIKICDYAKKICIETNNYKELPNIIFNKAYCLYALGYKKECDHLIYQVYYMMDSMENDKEKEMVKNYAMNKMGIVISEA